MKLNLKFIKAPFTWGFDKIEWLLGAFSHTSEVSTRKLQALGFFILVCYTHKKTVTEENAIYFLLVDCVTILLLYGIIHASDITTFFNNKKQDNN